MSSISYGLLPNQTASNISLLLTIEGIFILPQGFYTDTNSIDSLTPSSSSIGFNEEGDIESNTNINALARLEVEMNQLWDNIEYKSFQATNKEIEVANFLLKKFPNNTP